MSPSTEWERLAGIPWSATSLCAEGKHCLLLNGMIVYYGALGDPYRDGLKFDQVILNPKDAVRMKESSNVA